MKLKKKFLNIICLISGFFLGKFSGGDMPIDYFFLISTVIINLIIGLFVFPIIATINIGEIFALMLNKKIYIFKKIEKGIYSLLFTGIGAIISFAIESKQISLIGSTLLISSFCLYLGVTRVKKKYGDNFFEDN